MIFTNDSITSNSPKSLDGRYLKGGITPYSSVEDVNISIPKHYRYLGLTVAVIENGVLKNYWYSSSVENDGLTLKPRVSTINNIQPDDVGNVNIDKSTLNLNNINNTADIDKPLSSAAIAALSGKADLVNGKVPSSQLPFSQDTITEYANVAAFPATGASNVIYVALDTGMQYRWGGTSYSSSSGGVAIGETSSTAYRGDRGAIAYNHAIATGNPHGTTKAHLQLEYVDNTSDLAKPVSTATQNQLDLKVPKTIQLTIAGQTYDLSQNRTWNISGGSGTSDVSRTTFNDMKAITAPSSTTMYYISDPGKEGIWKYDPDDNVTTSDGGIVFVSDNGKRFKRVLDNNRVYLKWYTGTANMQPVLQNLFNNGYNVIGEPKALYNFNSGLSFTDKDVYFDGQGCTVVFAESGNDSFVTHTVTNNTWFNVLSVTSSTIVVSGIFPAKTGDVLKFFSPTEIIPGSDQQQRKGEFITPVLVTNDGTNTTITTKKSLTETYTTITDCRIAIIKKHTIEFRNTTIKLTNQHVNVAGGFELRGSYMPTFENVTFDTLSMPAFTIRGTFLATFEGIKVLNVINSINGDIGQAGSTGYGVNDNGSFGTKVNNCSFHGLRHAYTTGGSSSATQDYNYYGEVHGAIISNSTAKNCLHAWDTHPEGFNITFSNLYAENCAAGFQIRARGVTVLNSKTYKCGTGLLYYFDANSNGVGLEPLIVDGLIIEGTHSIGIEVDNKGTAVRHFDISNVYSSTPCYFGGASGDIRNMRLKLTSNYGIEVYNGVYNFRNVKMESSNLNWYGILFGGNSTKGNSTVYAENFQVTATGTTNPLLANPTGGTVNNVFVAKNWTFTHNSGPNFTHSGPAFPIYQNNFAAFTSLRVQWRTESMTATVSTENSFYMNVLPRGGVLEFDNKYLIDEWLYAKVTVPSNTDISSYVFSAGTFVGQRMTIHNTPTSPQTYTLTLPALNSGAPKVLAANASVTMVYTGTTTGWHYIV